jgi:hypothetical protein
VVCIPLFVPALDDGRNLWLFRTNYMSRTNLRPPAGRQNEGIGPLPSGSGIFN